MTKQKFYEMIVMETMRLARYDEKNPFYNIASVLGESDLESFSKMMIKLTLLGYGDRIPFKQPFDTLGFGYLAQIFGFVIHQENNEITEGFFSMLKKYPKMIDWSDIGQVDFICGVITDSITQHPQYDFTFCNRLVSLLVENFHTAITADEKNVRRCLGMIHSLGLGFAEDHQRIMRYIRY